MALELITNPPDVLAASGNWGTLLTRENASNLGTGLSIPIFTLTNWDSSTTIPAIAADSIIEVGGSLYQADADTAITLEGGISDGTVHIKLIPSGEATPLTLTPTLTNDAIPAWDANKAGWYTGANKYLPYEMTKTIAVYTLKGEYIDQNKTVKLDTIGIYDLTINGTLKYKKYYKSTASPTRGDIFSALSVWVPSVGDFLSCEGQTISTTSYASRITSISRTGTTQVEVYGLRSATTSALFLVSGIQGSSVIAEPIEIMSNFDVIS